MLIKVSGGDRSVWVNPIYVVSISVSRKFFRSRNHPKKEVYVMKLYVRHSGVVGLCFETLDEAARTMEEVAFAVNLATMQKK